MPPKQRRRGRPKKKSNLANFNKDRRKDTDTFEVLTSPQESKVRLTGSE